MAQFWIAIFFILLAIAQLYQSIKDINLPFPVYLILGTVLAVAANPHHKFSFAPTQPVTLQEVQTPDPALTTPVAPVLTATVPAPIVEAIAPKKPRARKTTAKSQQV
jgi:Na+/H+-dicarboxylate symporter